MFVIYNLIFAFLFIFCTFMFVGTLRVYFSAESKQRTEEFEQVDGPAKGWNFGAMLFSLLYLGGAIVSAYLLFTA